MGQPLTTKAAGICFAFPNVCDTQTPSGAIVPVPYPSIGQLSQTEEVAESVFAGGNAAVTSNSQIPSTTGDEAGLTGTISGSPVGGPVEFVTFSQTVFAEGHNVVRLSDTTKQNDGNAVGQVLGGVPTVFAGG